MQEQVTLRKFKILCPELFLKYALPCLEAKVMRKELSKEEFAGWIARFLTEGLTAENIETLFPVAVEELSKMQKNSLTEENIRQYFWRDHDEVVERRLPKKMWDICKIQPAVILKRGHDALLVAYSKGMKTVSPKLLGKGNKTLITIHYSHACEYISEKDFAGLWEKRMAEERKTGTVFKI